MSYRLLLVSADSRWADSVKRACAAQPISWEQTPSLSAAWGRLFENEADLALLDLDLPAAERLGWLRTLRAADAGGRLPVVLAGVRSEDELAEAFELGADDCVAKNCDDAELLARVKAVLRRRFERALVQEGVLAGGDVALDLSRRVCRVRGKPLSLNPREFELLEALLRRQGRVLTRPYLLETVWGMSARATTRSVDVCVSRLRKALGSRAGRWIETVERYGYRFRDPADSPR